MFSLDLPKEKQNILENREVKREASSRDFDKLSYLHKKSRRVITSIKKERVLKIDNTRINRIVNTFFGANIKFGLGRRELVSTGQMAPKEVVEILNEKEKVKKKYLFREFAFYISGGVEFVKYNIEFQDWLGKSKSLTPSIIRTTKEKGGRLYIESHDTDSKKKFLYVQEFVDCRNLAKTYKENGELIGSTLKKFHEASDDYLSQSKNIIPNCMNVNSEKIVREIYSWGRSDYYKRHTDNTERKEYDKLIEFSKKDINKYLINEDEYSINRMIVHGDYNPGNVIVSTSGDTAKVIDFDDLRIDHPAADLSHALCQMMVLKFFDKTIKDRDIPRELSDESKEIGEKIIKGYFKNCNDKSYIDEMFSRLKKEIPLAIHRGVLLGFLDFKISPQHFRGAKQNILLLNDEFNKWVESIKCDFYK